MRICLVNDYPLYYTGGAQTALFQQKKSLEAAGHTVIILQLGNKMPAETDDIIWFKGSISLSPFFNGISDSWVTKRTINRISNILRTHKVDVVHVQSELGLAHGAIQAAKQENVPVFHTVHTFFWQTDLPMQWLLSHILYLYVRCAYGLTLKSYNALAPQLKALTLSTAQAVDTVISPSQHQKKALLDAGLQPRCVVIANTFTSSSKIMPTLVPKNLKKLTFIWIGRCAPEKRLLEFLYAVTATKEQVTTAFEVEIIGTGPNLQKAKEFAASHQLSNIVTFHGNLPHEEVVRLLDTASVLVLTSYHFDNQPMVIAEAVSRFRGVVYCDERLVEGLSHCGVLTSSPQPNEIAKTLIELIKSPSKVHELSVKAKIDQEVFSREHYAHTIIKEYTRAIKGSSRRS